MKFVLLCVIVTFVNSGQYILDRKEKIPLLDKPFYVYKKENKLCPFRYYKRGQLVKKAIPCDAYVYVYDKNNSRCQARWQPNEQVNQLNTFTIQECQAEYNLTISPPSKFDALINIAKLRDCMDNNIFYFKRLKMDCKLEYQDCTLVNISSVKDIKFLDDDADGIFLGCDTKYNCSKNVSKTSVAYLKYCYTNTRWIWVEKAVESCSLYENCTDRLSVELVRNISSMKLISCGNESCTVNRPVLTMRYCDRPIEEIGDHEQNCEYIPYGGYCEILPSRRVAYINNNLTLDIIFRNSTFFKCDFDTLGEAFNCKESVKQISNLFCPKSQALKVGLIPQPKTDHLCNKIFDNCLQNPYNVYCSQEDLERFHNKTNNDVKIVTYTYCDTNQKIYKTQKALEAKSLENCKFELC
uniref:Uncharacterized protein n=1 Tax=Romanomermis culicivorax TaxID=13658 RepID=A0A915KUH2_ROMCU